MGNFIRSTVFNLLFYVLTALACVACLPTLFMPRKYFMRVVHGFVSSIYALEKHVLGLELEVRGTEHLPASGPYIVAAKHQSAYETFKLHLLFKDPAVILKRELLQIPLWGLYLKKSAPIAIDRSSPKSAIASIKEGAKRVAAEGRPITIFPQGTRVPVEMSADEKPYKIGVVRVQEATGLPIVPMAINAGYFWPKHKWIKKKGKVVFSFLPPIEAGMETSQTLKTLESAVESESIALVNEAREKERAREGSGVAGIAALAGLLLLLFGLYSFAWFEVAKRTKVEYSAMLENISGGQQVYLPPSVSGYPGKMRIAVKEETVQNSRGTLSIKDMVIKGWPLPFMPVEFRSGPIELRYFRWSEPLAFDALEGRFKMDITTVNILESTLFLRADEGSFTAHVEGKVNMSARPAPIIDLEVSMRNPLPLLEQLSESGILKRNMAMFIAAGLEQFKDDEGMIAVPVYQRDFRLYVGPLPVMIFDQPLEYDPELGAPLHPIQ